MSNKNFPLLYLGCAPDLNKVYQRLKVHNAIWIEGKGWSVSEDLHLSELNLRLLPTIYEVNGSFYCYNNKLTSLEGCPKAVKGDFYCSNNQLTSLEGCPETVKGGFDCSNNKLISLEGCPEHLKSKVIWK